LTDCERNYNIYLEMWLGAECRGQEVWQFWIAYDIF